MRLAGSSMIVTFDLVPGVRLAAAWSGGPYVQIHTVNPSGFGTVVEAWNVWDDWLDESRIPKTLEALEDFVRSRLDAPGAVDTLFELAEPDLFLDDSGDDRELVLSTAN